LFILLPKIFAAIYFVKLIRDEALPTEIRMAPETTKHCIRTEGQRLLDRMSAVAGRTV